MMFSRDITRTSECLVACQGVIPDQRHVSSHPCRVLDYPNAEALGRVLWISEIAGDWQSLPLPRRESTIENPNVRDAFLLQS